MSLNNLEIIKPHLKFRNEDDFYFVQIIQRKKDHPNKKSVTGTNNNNRLIKPYFVRSHGYLQRKMPEIIGLCDFFKARAGIDLNRRSSRDMAFHCLRKISGQIMNKDYEHIHKAYSTVCGKFSNEGGRSKKWILDIDGKTLSKAEFANLNNDLETIMPKGPKIIIRIPSNSGEHIITNPFNTKEFSTYLNWKDIEIHKRNPTNLYIPTL